MTSQQINFPFFLTLKPISIGMLTKLDARTFTTMTALFDQEVKDRIVAKTPTLRQPQELAIVLVSR